MKTGHLFLHFATGLHDGYSMYYCMKVVSNIVFKKTIQNYDCRTHQLQEHHRSIESCVVHIGIFSGHNKMFTLILRLLVL